MNATVNVPTRDEVSPANQALFDTLVKQLGFVPNLYATFAHSAHALPAYLALQATRSSLSAKEHEVVNLAVSEVNGCEYCLAAHSAIAKKFGYGDAQILEIRGGRASFDPRLDALARLVHEVALERGHADPAHVQAFLDAGWTKENLVDAIVAVGDKTITNFLHGTTRVPVDFPAAPPLQR
jgi:uncharacterized peroxidase-related enzyme